MKKEIKKAFTLAFTLAEIMIALVVIGVITSILLPVAFNSVPDENVMKFKKGNATLAKVINELVSSDKYYADGDLGKYPNGDLINGENKNDLTYFCQSFADVVSTKKVNCKGGKPSASFSGDVSEGSVVCSDWDFYGNNQPTQAASADKFCKTYTDLGEEIVTSDGIVYYETSAFPPFGWDKYLGGTNILFHESIGYANNAYTDLATTKINEINNAYRCKRVFCMDIDGIGKGEDPFGYGIRVDGKIVLGERAKEWLNKSIQDKD